MNENVPWLLWQKCEFVEMLVLWPVWNGTAPFIAHLWLRRMEPHRRENRWSWLYWAVVATSTPFGPAALIPFAWRTRRVRGFWPGSQALATGLGLALLGLVAYVGLATALQGLAELIFGDGANPPL